MSFFEVWERVKSATGMKTFGELANSLNIKQPSVSKAKTRGKFPAEWVFKIAKSYNLNSDWIMFGENQIDKLDPATAKKILPTLRDDAVKAITGLNTMMDMLESKPPKASVGENDDENIASKAQQYYAAGHELDKISEILGVDVSELNKWKDKTKKAGETYDQWDKARQKRKDIIKFMRQSYDDQMKFLEEQEPEEITTRAIEAFLRLGRFVEKLERVYKK